MKRLLKAIIVTLLIMGTIINGINVSFAKEQSELSKEIQSLIEKEEVKTLLGEKSISEFMRDIAKEIDQKRGKKEKGNSSLDINSFSSDRETYDWLANAIVLAVKKAINIGELTQDLIDQMSILSIFGIKVPKVKISKEMNDSEIEESIAIPFVKLLQSICNKQTLKFLGIDFEDPKVLEDIKRIIAERTLSNN